MSATKFTPEARGALIERVASGVSLADAARAIGLREKTVKGWITRGRREDGGDYAEFAQRIEQARREADERPEPMDADELARVVSEAARKGSVAAMKLRHEQLGAKDAPEHEPADEFDELKARRASRAA